MKTVSSIKSNATKCESPKTPGGISKAFLTPVRRVGLSKNWRKSGPSPFVSPLTRDSSTPTTQAIVENKPAKKRGRVLKTEVDIHEDEDKTPSNSEKDDAEDLETPSLSESELGAEIVTTPSRNIQLPHKSKSQSSISVKVGKDRVTNNPVPGNDATPILSETLTAKAKVTETLTEKDNVKPDTKTNSDKVEETVAKPVRKKSVKKNVKASPQKTSIVKTPISNEKTRKILTDSTVLNTATTGTKPEKGDDCESTKPKSPNDLTKECIVVIQRKINKRLEKATKPDKTAECFVDITKPKENLVSQALFDSDSDDAPLSTINKKNCDETKIIANMKRPRQLDLEEDDDFCNNKRKSLKIKKLEDKCTSSSDLKLKCNRDATLKNNKQIQQKTKVNAQRIINVERSSHDSNSFDEEDDDFEVKRTILVRKTYNKYHVVKPQKARSTGSISKKDIEDLKARIEMKKNLLLAKSVCPDTEDLRNLTKKWKKGCQDALQELMELMKNKFPDKQGMDYSEMLQLLQIPSSLVGYNSDDDCFTSPDDAGIILSKFN